ncbi:bacillithiol biosynthesis deacetylase BshB1 [bacterium]|nr:bacillithiol biosynthesis deacetylase BshB1 [bacterium]
MLNGNNLDLLVFAPHPDDAEIATGGLLAKLARQGRRVGIVDLTRGSWGTKGDADTRVREAAAAAKVLGLCVRECLALPDGRLEPTMQQRRLVAECIRRLRPRIVLAPLEDDPHPDHHAAHHLVRGASLWARLPKAEVVGEPWSVRRLVFYPLHRSDGRPSFLVDINEHLETKLAAMACFASQFIDAVLPEGYTYLATSDYLARARANAAYYGQMAGTLAAEAYWTDTPPVVGDVIEEQ